MGLENIVDGMKNSISSNLGTATTGYVKRALWHEVLDTLVTGAFALYGAASGAATAAAYGYNPLLYTFGGTVIGGVVGKIVTWPLDIYAGLKNIYQTSKEALGKDKEVHGGAGHAPAAAH